MLWIYDLETFPNFFSGTFKDYKTKGVKQFVISEDRNDLESLIDFVDNPHLWLVGYNNYHFDNQLLKFIVENRFMYMGEDPTHIAKNIYDFARSVIEDDWREHMYSLPFRSLDVMKIGNLSQKSLKIGRAHV